MYEIERLLTAWDVDPKFKSFVWKSDKYRKWIADNYHCPCRGGLCDDTLNIDGSYLHHHRHAGGKDKPNDALLTPFSPECHQRVHYSQNAKEQLYKRSLLETDEGVQELCNHMLMNYLTHLIGPNFVTNLLGHMCKDIENE